MNDPVLESLRGTTRFLNARLKEREAVVRALILSLLSGEHLYLVGPPGTGKSLLVRLAASRYPNLRYFERLLHQESDRAALSRSPLSEVGLSDGSIVFLDEILRAPKTLLLTLLSFMNERIWHDPAPRPAALISLFAASNSHPSQADGIEAFFDRFALRCFVEPVRRFDSFSSLVAGDEREEGVAQALEDEGPFPFGEEDFRKLHRRVRQEIALGPGIPEALWELRGRLSREGVGLSDRRWKMVAGVLKAIAVFDGAGEVERRHLAQLLPVLWTYPPEIRSIRRVLGEILRETARPAGH